MQSKSNFEIWISFVLEISHIYLILPTPTHHPETQRSKLAKQTHLIYLKKKVNLLFLFLFGLKEIIE